MYEAWTDGACMVHEGKCGGYAVVIDDGKGKRNTFKVHVCETTSQRMEISAVIMALVSTPPGSKVRVKTDSQYVVGCTTKGWKRRVNNDLFAMLDELMSARDVQVKWIPRNSEDPHALADELSKIASTACPKKGLTDPTDSGNIISEGGAYGAANEF